MKLLPGQPGIAIPFSCIQELSREAGSHAMEATVKVMVSDFPDAEPEPCTIWLKLYAPSAEAAWVWYTCLQKCVAENVASIEEPGAAADTGAAASSAALPAASPDDGGTPSSSGGLMSSIKKKVRRSSVRIGGVLGLTEEGRAQRERKRRAAAMRKAVQEVNDFLDELQLGAALRERREAHAQGYAVNVWQAGAAEEQEWLGSIGDPAAGEAAGSPSQRLPFSAVETAPDIDIAAALSGTMTAEDMKKMPLGLRMLADMDSPGVGMALWQSGPASDTAEPVAIAHGWLSKVDRSGLFVRQLRERYFVLTPKALLYFAEASHLRVDAAGYVMSKATGKNTSWFSGAGASIPLQDIVEISLRAVEVTKAVSSSVAGHVEDGADVAPVDDAAERRVISATAAVSGDVSDQLWVCDTSPGFTLELDCVDSVLTLDTHNARVRNCWIAALGLWKCLDKRAREAATWGVMGKAGEAPEAADATDVVATASNPGATLRLAAPAARGGRGGRGGRIARRSLRPGGPLVDVNAAEAVAHRAPTPGEEQ